MELFIIIAVAVIPMIIRAVTQKQQQQMEKTELPQSAFPSAPAVQRTPDEPRQTTPPRKVNGLRKVKLSQTDMTPAAPAQPALSIELPVDDEPVHEVMPQPMEMNRLALDVDSITTGFVYSQILGPCKAYRRGIR